MNPVTQERFDAAVHRTLRLRADRQGESLHSLAAIAVEETFCLCVTGAEDAIEQKLSEIHAALIVEVERRAATTKAPNAPPTRARDVVQLASEQSFPASDPPAWIWAGGRDAG